jgi:hypothetical protein
VARIFISYKRSDGHGGRIYDSLRERMPDDELFMDVETLMPGSDFEARIRDFLADCDIFLAVISPAWVEQFHGRKGGEYIRLEMEAALRSAAWLIPVLVGGARIPEKLPRAVRGLAAHHAIELSDERWSYDAGRLVDCITDVMATRRKEVLADHGSAGSGDGEIGAREQWQEDVLDEGPEAAAATGTAPTGLEAATPGAPEVVVPGAAEQLPDLAAWACRRLALDGIATRTTPTARGVAIVCQVDVRIPRVSRAIPRLSANAVVELRESGPDIEVVLIRSPFMMKAMIAAVGFAARLPVMGVAVAGGAVYRSVHQRRLERRCQAIMSDMRTVGVAAVVDGSDDAAGRPAGSLDE